MPNINIEVSEELLQAVRIACARTGMSQKQMVTMCLEQGIANRQKTTEEMAYAPILTSHSGALKVTCGEAWIEGMRKADAATENFCPEDGKPMIWNKVMRRFVCECGYQGKVQRT